MIQNCEKQMMQMGTASEIKQMLNPAWKREEDKIAVFDEHEFSNRTGTIIDMKFKELTTEMRIELLLI